jgi:hypothetical protein
MEVTGGKSGVSSETFVLPVKTITEGFEQVRNLISTFERCI